MNGWKREQSSVKSPYSKRGMTLIELLIVLGIMAALATVALTTLDGMGDRTRMDTTRARLDAIEEAIVGDGLKPGRFVSDMGRLPVVHYDKPNPAGSGTVATEEGETLIELWNSYNLAADASVYDYSRMAVDYFKVHPADA